MVLFFYLFIATFLCPQVLDAACSNLAVFDLASKFDRHSQLISEEKSSTAAGTLFSNCSPEVIAFYQLRTDNIQLPILTAPTIEEELEKTEITKINLSKIGRTIGSFGKDFAIESLDIAFKTTLETADKIIKEFNNSTSTPMSQYKKAYTFINEQLKFYDMNSSYFSIQASNKPAYNWGAAGWSLIVPEADLKMIESGNMTNEDQNKYKFLIAHQATHMSDTFARSAEQIGLNTVKKQYTNRVKRVMDFTISKALGAEGVIDENQLSVKQKMAKTVLDKGKFLALPLFVSKTDKAINNKLQYVMQKYECMADIDPRMDENAIMGGISLLQQFGKAINTPTSLEACDKCLSDPYGDRLHALHRRQNQMWIDQFVMEQAWNNQNRFTAKL